MGRTGKAPKKPKSKITVCQKSIIMKAYTLAGRVENFVVMEGHKEGDPPPAPQPGFRAWRESFRAQGMTTDMCWTKAQEMVPIADHFFQQAKDEYWTRAANKHKGVVGEIARFESLDAVEPILEAREVTGVPLIDWVYANIKSRPDGKLTSKPEGAGDLHLLCYYRDHRDEFYNKVWLPAMMKKLAIAAAADPPPSDDQPEPDKAQKSTADLLNRLEPAPTNGVVHDDNRV